MKNNKGITLAALVVSVLILAIIISVTVVGLIKVLKESKLQDLKTNMLLIKANGKKNIEEFSFKTANLNKNNSDDLAKINEFRTSLLKGTPYDSSPTDVKSAVSAISEINDASSYYYLTEEDINDMGLNNIKLGEGEYYLIKYDETNLEIEVLNTKGYTKDGTTYYTLTQLQNIETSSIGE